MEKHSSSAQADDLTYCSHWPTQYHPTGFIFEVLDQLPLSSYSQMCMSTGLCEEGGLAEERGRVRKAGLPQSWQVGSSVLYWKPWALLSVGCGLTQALTQCPVSSYVSEHRLQAMFSHALRTETLGYQDSPVSRGAM